MAVETGSTPSRAGVLDPVSPDGQLPLIMSAYHQEGRTTSNRINCGRKRKLSERDVRVLTQIVSKKHKTMAAQITAELNVHLNSPVSTRTVRRELHRVNIHGRAAIAKPLVTH
ncbi:hypothetical protein CHARACLAT_012265, partial [Characodon lateralis]|nr:hypothetical protein [Characodon lateralis]